MSDLLEDKAAYREEQHAGKYAGIRTRVPLRIEHILGRPLTNVVLNQNLGRAKEVADLSIFRWYTHGIHDPVQPSEEAALDS